MFVIIIIIIIIIIISISIISSGSNSVRKFQIEITWRVKYSQVNLKRLYRYSAVGQVRGGQCNTLSTVSDCLFTKKSAAFRCVR